MTFLIALLLAASPSMRVVVYPDRAQVTLGAGGVCGARNQASVQFEGITPAADAGSFRAVSADGAILGVRAELRASDKAFAPEADKVEAEIRQVEAQARALEDVRARAGQQARVAGSLADVAAQLVSREMVLPAPDTLAWDHAFDASLQSRGSAASASIKAEAELREVRRRLYELRRRRAELGQAMQRKSYRAEVLVGCPQGETVHAELTYLVGGASWEPLYEARADEKSGRVELSMFATVRQSTGESWKKAQVVLSTAIPRSDATPPEVRPLRVGALERKAEKKVLVRRDEEQRHAEEAGGGVPAEEGPAGMEAQAQGLSVRLQARDLAEIAGDGTPARLFVGAHKLAATFAYRTVPKLMPFVFRVADLVNTAPFPLLPGSVDAFRRSGFIARTALERVAEGQKFHLSFGLEENIKVKRLVLDEIQRDAGLFGQNRRFHYAYRVELTSHLERPEQVEVEEHVPVSELDDVKVELEDKTTPGRKLGADDGIVTWKIELPPRAKKSVELAFHVDVPGSYESGGL